VIILFSLLTPFFFTASNLLLISRQMAILGVIAVGMTFVLASGEVDLSVGWTFNMVMSAMAMLMVSGVNPWLTIPIGLALGVLLGVFNGLFAVIFKLPTIIVTLGTLTLYRGLALSVSGGRTVGNLPESSFFEIGSGNLGGVPLMSIIMIVVFVVGAWLLRNTQFARHLLALGANRQAAERVGMRVARLRILVMAFSGLMCGIAGVLGLAFLGAADAQSGSGYELTAIAAAIIGGAKLGGGSGTVWGTLIGIALIMAIQNGLALMGLPPAWQISSTGIVLIAAVTVDYLTRSRRRAATEQILNP
ncbi:MAG: ABC transporter permease, partial [Anaerolineae bacterium]|nr:ABC transporter permease [Anaerolineae bacterium]